MSAPLKDIGALNRRLELEAPVETGDAAGGVVRTYEAVATLWAQVMPVSARSDIAGDHLGAVLRHRIVPNFKAQGEGLSSRDIIGRLLTEVKPSSDGKLGK